MSSLNPIKNSLIICRARNLPEVNIAVEVSTDDPVAVESDTATEAVRILGTGDKDTEAGTIKRVKTITPKQSVPSRSIIICLIP